jgi:hypothetical protein
MSLTAEEVLDLASEVHALGQAVAEARDPSSERGKRLSRTERKRIAMQAAKLALRLVIDLLD